MKISSLQNHDADEFKEMIVKFHEDEFMISNMSSFGLHRLYPEVYNGIKSEAIEFGNSIIEEFISEISNWIGLHDEDNPETFFEKRYEMFLESVETFVNEPVGSILSGPAYLNFSINMKTLFKYIERVGLEEEFVDWFYETGFGSTAYDAWDEHVENYYRDEISHEFPEIEGEELENKLDKIRETIDYKYLFDSLIDYIESVGTPDTITNTMFFDSEVVRKAMYSWWMDIGMKKMIDRWESARAQDDSVWIQNTTNLKQVRLAKQNLNMLENALKSQEISDKQIAITLALNLQHNAGNLLDDHMEIGEDFLDVLDNMDVGEWRTAIDEMVNKTGQTKDQLYAKEKETKEQEEYMKSRLQDTWQWKADREIHGKKTWYSRNKEARTVRRRVQ